MREADDTGGDSALVADLGVTGVWQPQSEALVSLTQTPSHMSNWLNIIMSNSLTNGANRTVR